MQARGVLTYHDKANSAILNALLSILNERVYFNGKEKEQVPLLFLIAASNELPDDNEQLAALYDRFLFRYEVSYLHTAASYESMFNLPTEPLPALFSLYDVKDVQAAAKQVTVPETLVYFLYQLKQDMEEKEFVLSDRRWSKIGHVWRTSAALNGRDTVTVWDTVYTPHLLWDVPEDLPLLRQLFEVRFTDLLKTETQSELPLRQYEQVAQKWLDKESELHAFQFKKEVGAKMGKEQAEQFRLLLETCRSEVEETARSLKAKLIAWQQTEKDLVAFIRDKNYLIHQPEKYTVKYAHLRIEGERLLQILQGLYRTIFDRDIAGAEYDYTL